MPYPGLLTFPSDTLFPGDGSGPAPTPAWVSESQITLGSLVFNREDSNGTYWLVNKFDGWGGTAPTLQTVQKTRQSGFWAGDSYSQGRPMTLSGWILSKNPAQHSLDIDTLIGAVSKQPTLMQVSEMGRVRWCMVQRASEVTRTPFAGATQSQFTFQVVSLDWRKFGDTLTGTTSLPSSTGGMTYPMTFPYSYDAVSVSGQVSLVNRGNEFGPVILRIDGPCVGPKVTHVSSGKELVFASSLTLGAGEFLIVDNEAKTVLANGQASRAGWVTSRGWASMQPGPNTWAFDAITYNAASQLSVTATESWE
jgi:hypothetical protein